jgi:hypothetical protein
MGSYSQLVIGVIEFLELRQDQEMMIYQAADEKLQNEFSQLAMKIGLLDRVTSDPIEQRRLVKLCCRIEKLSRRVESRIKRQEVINNDI